jgi:flagellar motor switch protein FliG
MAKPIVRKDEQDPGVRKAAIAILALGSDLARDVFDVLEPEEIQQILRASEEIGDVDGEEVLRVLNELTVGNERQVRGMSGHNHLLHEAAVDVLGEDHLSMVMANEVEEDESKRRLSAMARSDPAAFAQVLLKEHPQVVAIVGSVLNPKDAAKVWEYMPVEVKSEAVRRIATMRSVPAHVMREVVQAVGAELDSARSNAPVDIDGMDSAVQLLKSAGTSQQLVIFEELKKVDEELAENIRRRMFIFEDIINLHARDVQRILRDVDSQTLPVALKNASTELQEHILGNMSQRASEMIMEDMEVLGPVTVKRVMEAQEGIVEVILRMSDEGKVNLNPEDAI